ncbi:type IV conjugative transfer system pilin TraA [Ursidibacter arcticus]
MSNTLVPSKGNSKFTLSYLVAFMAFMVVLFSPINAYAADLAAGAKSTIKDTFGSGSTFLYTLYLLEVLSGIFLYIKTKNLAVFGGIIAVIIFTTVAFALF